LELERGEGTDAIELIKEVEEVLLLLCGKMLFVRFFIWEKGFSLKAEKM
jgi:hypothetical protein